MSANTLPASIERQLLQFDTDLNSFIAELSTYDDGQLNTKPANGGWSAMQCVEHLKLAEQHVIHYIGKKLSNNPELPKKGFGDRLRKSALKAFLASSLKFKAPKGVGTESLPTHSDPAKSFAEWRAQRPVLKSTLEQIDPVYFQRKVYKHPFMGRISLETTIAFLGYHLARHRKQALAALKTA